MSANASLQMTAEEQIVYEQPCQPAAIAIPEPVEQTSSSELTLGDGEGQQAGEEGFWDNWAGHNNSPVLSSNTRSTYYGVGVWLPEKYQDLDVMTLEDAQQWIKNHGLQMSLGVGGEDGRSARFRVDYRWHEERLNDLFLQVEIPFQ
ncbi:hypothetical protein VV869_12920 [Photobacterium sp. MCCC 1A19761]|uniref:hypothetical protein n=1 Tax=Photobacterium sp. MCCC 1A19761 TaxID=3115000 RepID=UPI00307E685F